MRHLEVKDLDGLKKKKKEKVGSNPTSSLPGQKGPLDIKLAISHMLCPHNK